MNIRKKPAVKLAGHYMPVTTGFRRIAFLAILFFSLSCHRVHAQTTLAAGDIAFTGYIFNNVTPPVGDAFSFILLANISSGTSVHFTDNGWQGSSFRTGETDIEWVSNAAYPVGTEITITSGQTTAKLNSGASAGNLTITGAATLSLSFNGDQVLCYQGTTLSAGVTFITAIHSNVYTGSPEPYTTTASAWEGASSDPNSSAVPTGLISGTTAIWLGTQGSNASEVVNARYNCSGSMSSVANIKSSIYNYSNWTKDLIGVGTGVAPTFTLPTSCAYLASTSTTWNGTTWSAGTPSATVDAIIASSITPGAFTCKTLTINSGSALTIGSGVTVNINGDIANNGNGISGVGTLNVASSGTISGNMISLSGGLTVASGATLTTGGLLRLKSDATGTGRIGNSAGTISGNVTMERYIPGKRAFRFIAHPFTDAVAMSEFTDDIDITGTGGSPFTATATNNPSAFYFDPTTGDNTTTGNNPGWAAFTSSATLARYQGMRVLVRGAKTEGLTSAAYTPSATTIDLTGAVNQGTQVVSLTKGSGTNFVIIGNPLPSQIDLNATTGRTNVGSAFYVWDATIGTKGGYTSASFSSSYILPSCASFVTTISANGSITFPESCKSASAAAGLFKPTATIGKAELRMEDSTTFWDRLLIHFDDNTISAVDYEDAPELYNPELSFYTFSSNDSALSIDSRPFTNNESIKLGLYTPYQKNYKIVAADVSIPTDGKLYLHDKYLNLSKEITGSGWEYWFEVTSDTNSTGNRRFELNMKVEPTGIVKAGINLPALRIIPNPVHDYVNIQYENINNEPAIINISDMTGRVIHKVAVPANQNSIQVSLIDVPAGVYVVELQNGSYRAQQKLVKQ